MQLLVFISSHGVNTTPHCYLLSRTAIRSGGEGQEHRVTQEVQVGLKTWYT